ncbi:unnamed protein product [Moneuplotes crassus]|uniref:Uncharacterized protein n=1 Tax=Euplotes crassus TaxID=5936 RepID=A0AAD1XTE6_EUPCR|nr:unnamed protein product [Moneuplotes crassus]
MGAAAVAIAGFAYYLLSSSEVEEEEIQEEFPERLTMEKIEAMLSEDIAQIKKISKKDAKGLTQEFLLEIFRVLKKYVTLVQSLDEEERFERRIQLLKEGKEQEYYQVKEEANRENNFKINKVTTNLYKELDFTDLEYATGVQKNAYDPDFAKKCEKIDKTVIDEIKEFQSEVEIPEDLTIEKAKEIRKNVQEETKKDSLRMYSRIDLREKSLSLMIWSILSTGSRIMKYWKPSINTSCSLDVSPCLFSKMAKINQ